MRSRLAALGGALLWAASAHATPTILIDGSSTSTDLEPGNNFIPLGITPDANQMSAFNLLFEISDPSITLVSCSPNSGIQANCTPGSTTFSFSATFATDKTATTLLGFFTVSVAQDPTPGAKVTLLATSTVTTGAAGGNQVVPIGQFIQGGGVFVGAITIAEVPGAVPEPLLGTLLGAGGLGLLTRKRRA
jgi:hypothetical protein